MKKQQSHGGLARTPGGKPSAQSWKSHGMRSKQQKGKLPIGDKKSAESALNLLHHVKPSLTKQQKLQQIERARKYAPEAAKRARRRLQGKS